MSPENKPDQPRATATDDGNTVRLRTTSAAIDIRSSSKGRGYGVFACRALPKRHVIIFERPILSCTHRLQPPYESTVAEEWKNFDHKQRRTLADHFRKLRKIPQRSELYARDRKRLRQFIVEYAFADPANGKAHVYALASHINHACISCANAEQWVDPVEPNFITVRLMKPVSQDEEVLIHYNRRNLKFDCACSKARGLRGAWKALSTKVKGSLGQESNETAQQHAPDTTIHNSKDSNPPDNYSSNS